MGTDNCIILEGTARYAGLLLAPADGFSPGFFVLFCLVKCVIQVAIFKGHGCPSYIGGIGGRQGRQHYCRHKKALGFNMCVGHPAMCLLLHLIKLCPIFS